MPTNWLRAWPGISQVICLFWYVFQIWKLHGKSLTLGMFLPIPIVVQYREYSYTPFNLYITLPVNVRYPTRPAVSTSTCRLGRVVHICIINTRWNTQWACRSWIMYMILWYHPGVILTISQGEYQDDGSYSTHLVRVRCITSNRSHEFSVLFPHFTKCKGNVA